MWAFFSCGEQRRCTDLSTLIILIIARFLSEIPLCTLRPTGHPGAFLRRAPSLSSRQFRGAVGGNQAGRPRRVNSLGEDGEEDCPGDFTVAGLPRSLAGTGGRPWYTGSGIWTLRANVKWTRCFFSPKVQVAGALPTRLRCGTSCQTEAEASSLHLPAS